MEHTRLRAWDLENQVMHYNFNFITTGTTGKDTMIFTSSRQPDLEKAIANPVPFKQFVLMGCTDQSDVNGITVYEGDMDKDGGKIIWDKDNSAYLIDYPGIETQELVEIDTWLEIISNIYEA